MPTDNPQSEPAGESINRRQRVGRNSQASIWPFEFPLWSYALVIAMGIVAFTGIFVVFTLRTINQLEYWTTEGWFVGWGWAAITTFAFAWAVANVHWAKQSLSELKIVESYSHWVIAICCGLAALGLHYISLKRSYNEGPNIVDPQALLPAESPVESLSGPIYGRATRGKGWFGLTCVTCHGPNGDGINNLAPSLRDSEFLKTADPVAINLLIRRGRLATDPANKSGKPMPPRGGDVTLTDEKIADLVAHVMTLHGRTADPQTLTWEGIEAPPPTLSVKTLMIRSQNPAVRKVNLAALTIHGVFVGVVIASSLHLLLGWLRGWAPKRCRPWMYVNSWGWLMALISWLSIVFVLGMVDSTIWETLF